MEIETTKAGEMYVLALKGDVAGTDVPGFAAAVQKILNAKGMNLVLDLERCASLCQTMVAAFGELGSKLARAGGALVLAGGKPELLGAHAARLKAGGEVVVAESRGLGMALLMNRISVRGQLLGFIRQALSTVYVSPHQPGQPVTCRFVKHLQNFLVYALEPPYDGTLRRGMSLRFTMQGCGEDGTRTVSFDGTINRFGTLQDGSPCLVVKVPDLLEIEEDRREDPRVKVRFQCTWYPKAAPHQIGYGTMEDISSEGASLRATSFPYQVGQLVMLEPDFRNWKLLEPIHLEVVHLRHDAGEVLVGGRFVYVNPGDQARIDQFILETSKW